MLCDLLFPPTADRPDDGAAVPDTDTEAADARARRDQRRRLGGLRAAARRSGDRAMAGALLVAPAAPPTDGDRGARLVALVDGFATEAGLVGAALCLHGLPQAAGTAAPLAAEAFLAARVRLVRVVAGWRAFACPPGLAPPAVLADPRVRAVLRCCLHVARLDPGQPEAQPRRAAALLLGCLATTARNPAAVEGLGRLAAPGGPPRWKRAAEAAALVRRGSPALLARLGLAALDDAALLAAWVPVQNRAADGDLETPPVRPAPEGRFEEAYFADAATLALACLRPLVPTKAATDRALARLTEST